VKFAIINRGIPGSGKSAFVKRLKEEFGEIAVHSTDDFFYQNGEYKFDKNKLIEYHQKNLENFIDSLKKVDLVVCDNTNILPEFIYPYINEANKKRFKVILVNFKPIDIKEHLKRNIHNVPIEVLFDMQINLKKYDNEVKKLFSKYFDIDSRFFNQDIEQVIKYIEKMKKSIKSDYELSNRVKATLYILQKLIQIKKPLSAEDFYNDEDFRQLTADSKKDNQPLSKRRIKDILNGLYNFYENIEVDIDDKNHTFKWIDKNDLVIKALVKSDDISWILSDLNQSNPEILKDLEDDIKNILQDEKDIFVFKNYIMENLEGKESIFKELKSAVKNKEKRKIIYEYNQKEEIEVNCLKLVFVDNNWYLAVETNNAFKFLRLSFIKQVKPNYLGKRYKNTKKYDEFLKTFQNSLTLYGNQKKTAKILATKKIAKYFKKDMKKFLPSQRFIKENEDESVEFEITYTQPLEILPFIKRWLPNLSIISPEELREELKKDLENALKIYK